LSHLRIHTFIFNTLPLPLRLLVQRRHFLIFTTPSNYSPVVYL
jgi:hypothetical protein